MIDINDIREARIKLLSEDRKEKILINIKNQLLYNGYARIDGAAHYGNKEWNFPTMDEKHQYQPICYAPFKFHPAIAEWLNRLGFHTSRYYNKGGVDNGLKVWI